MKYHGSSKGHMSGGPATQNLPRTASKWEVWFAWYPVRITDDTPHSCGADDGKCMHAAETRYWVWLGPVARRHIWDHDSKMMHPYYVWQYAHFSKAITQ